MERREKLMDEIIRKFGFENKKTVEFCKTASVAPMMVVEIQYHALMKK